MFISNIINLIKKFDLSYEIIMDDDKEENNNDIYRPNNWQDQQ